MFASFAGYTSPDEWVGALIGSVGLGAVAAGVFACFAFACVVVPFLTLEASYWLLFNFTYFGPAVADRDSSGKCSVGSVNICK